MDNFKKLLSLCDYSVLVEVNDHRDYGDTVIDYINRFKDNDVPKDVLDKMIELNTVVKVQAYPKSSNGFYMVFHYDIDECINQVLEAVESEANP